MSEPVVSSINELPNDLLTRILVAAATEPANPLNAENGGIDLRMGSALSRVCKRWRGLCFSAPGLWETLFLRACPRCFYVYNGNHEEWRRKKLWLLQRVGPLVRHLHIANDSYKPGMLEPLMRAAPHTLRSLQLRTGWGPHSRDQPQLLALARVRCPSLASLDLDLTGDRHRRDPAAEEQRLLASVVEGLAGLAGSLTELRLYMPPVQLHSLEALAALRRLRRLVVFISFTPSPLRMPAPALFPCLEAFAMNPVANCTFQVGGFEIMSARWTGDTLGLWPVDAAALPAQLVAMRPPAAGRLKNLSLMELRVGGDAAAAKAALHACASHWVQVSKLSVSGSPELAASALELLLRQLPRLEKLKLNSCCLDTLPVGPYLSGLRTLSVTSNQLLELPPALLQATRLQRLDLSSNRNLRPFEAELRQLLQALPDLQQLDLTYTGIGEDTAAALKAVAAERGLAVQLPQYFGGWETESNISAWSQSSADDG